jgi:hypothetical protein
MTSFPKTGICRTSRKDIGAKLWGIKIVVWLYNWVKANYVANSVIVK